jgi:glycosyltransferase involved in cell wall biosynthesis
LRVFYVIPYWAPPPFEARRDERIYRERRIVADAAAKGIDCRLYIFSDVPALCQEHPEQPVWLVPFDGQGGSPFSYHSDELLEIVNREAPDLVVVKGLGHKFTRWLMCKSQSHFRIALIAAGNTQDPVLPYVDHVLAETPAQIQRPFRELDAAGRVSLLPKLNLPFPFSKQRAPRYDVVNVGTFNPNKNQAALLPLADRYRLALVGDGECWDGVRSQAATAVCPVFMPGNLPREQVGGVIAQSRLMVHSAKYEGLPRVVMEAFAAGVPVVASRRAMPGAFEHGVQGLLVEPDDLLEAARSLLEDPPRLAAMGQAASAYAERCCSEQAVFTEVSRMYAKVMERPPLYTGSWWQKAHILVRSARMGGLSRARELAVALGAKRVLTWLGMRK